MTTPSWRQLAAIPESTLKAQILNACGITPPPEGISNVFQDRGVYVRYSPPQDSNSYWVVSLADTFDQPVYSMIHSDGSDVLKAASIPASIPMGQALRSWLRSKGWVPKNERPTIDPQANTKTII